MPGSAGRAPRRCAAALLLAGLALSASSAAQTVAAQPAAGPAPTPPPDEAERQRLLAEADRLHVRAAELRRARRARGQG